MGSNHAPGNKAPSRVKLKPALTLLPMGGGHCVSRQFEIDSIQAGMKF